LNHLNHLNHNISEPEVFHTYNATKPNTLIRLINLNLNVCIVSISRNVGKEYFCEGKTLKRTNSIEVRYQSD